MTRTVLQKNRQLALDLHIRPMFGRQDFFVAPCNKEAVALIDGFPYPFFAALIYGEHGSGKTHLTHLFEDIVFQKTHEKTAFLEAASLSDAVVFDALRMTRYAVLENVAGGVDETAFFHLINGIKDVGGSVLVTSETSYTAWQLTLPDLISRLSAVPVIGLGKPDDTAMAAVLVKLFADRQLVISPEVIAFLLKNMERSFAAACTVVDAVDKESLAEKRQVTVPFLSRLLKTEGNASC